MVKKNLTEILIKNEKNIFLKNNGKKKKLKKL